MCDKTATEQLENRIATALLLLYEAQSFIKFGALASDSCIDDLNLQLNKSFDDYYLLLKNINNKVGEAVEVLKY